MSLRSLAITASPLQLLTYLLGVCLFSISFLVFLNSSVSFVITDRIGQKKGVGNAVGNLGFADELVALVACPIWGVLSDKVGVRSVTVVGYSIVGVALMGFVRARNVYPELLIGRMLFAIGGSATSTMVSAILPSMTYKEPPAPLLNVGNAAGEAAQRERTPSTSSQSTITPTHALSPTTTAAPAPPDPITMASRLAGFVGLFTGSGALLALLVFLPLPANLTAPGHTRAQALVDAYTIVGAIAIFVASLCSFGLTGLPGETGKSWVNLLSVFRTPQTDALFASEEEGDHGDGDGNRRETSAPHLLWQAIKLAGQDRTVLLAYTAGFVARASSVAISLFIPLLVNTLFVSAGKCPDSESIPGGKDWKDDCKRAYVLASILTGVSQLIALLCAPLFGFLGTGGKKRRVLPGRVETTGEGSNWPLMSAAAAGVVGYAIVAFRKLDIDVDGKGGGSARLSSFATVTLLGYSQIGAIVCSLSLLARGVQNPASNANLSPFASDDSDDATTLALSEGEEGDDIRRERSPLLGARGDRAAGAQSRAHLKGSMAGVYSLSGGAGILILTKVGGWVFDNVGLEGPFWIMAAFNALLLAVGIFCSVTRKREGVSIFD